ncbi:hypothetical protein EV643_114238 [Kribbella sp. VKM Ac-2527]|uniref:Uncharacterized protein n=1 Tax=Kribbella caucasensis TaxID=2512215 RepID=A0A4R6K7W1_9ACTN|nr:hypothetical protein [Kribbella sp. VKM Ac-2527]TDO45093.1 hypothetical protein EV643_114238 [Kribbella sp. VKM Ac-2527]
MTQNANPHDVVRAVLLADYRPIEDSIDIVREKYSGKDAAFAVSFVDRDGTQRCALVGLCRHEGGWQPSGGFMGSARPIDPQDVWMTYGGWGPGGPKERAVVGGWVADPSAVAARLTDTTGDRVLKDNVVDGVAIFMWKGELDLRHARMELLDTDHQVLRAGPMRRMEHT